MRKLKALRQMVNHQVISYKALNIVLAFGIIVVGFTASMFGQVSLTFSQVIGGLFGQETTAINIIVQELRLPRILLGGICGAVLGYAGALLQGLLRNPLADPGVIGVSASASLGAVVAIYFGLSVYSPFAVPIAAIMFALLATVVLAVIASRDTSILTLILAGVGISSIAAAGISLVMNFAPQPMTLQEMILWMMGSLENRGFNDLYLSLPFVLVGLVLVLGVGNSLNALGLGEETAQSLGVNLKRLRLRIVGGVAFSVGAMVAVAGAIGFVGLVVPHFARTMVGHEPKRVLVPSGLMGAILIMIADILTRLPFGQGQLRLGVVMGIIGAPMFLYVVLKTRSEMR
ncbi:FecCD family ABC transporter permease [Kordiimonas aquimaris]|uniref:FecCD family ABC transporter permease n=1 Tax=Kordiimonas aquimaris TaxID=707591 RepID=UPI0021D2246E|nr:iron ABC transporter permease [Kordiimonas aquimaris]